MEPLMTREEFKDLLFGRAVKLTDEEIVIGLLRKFLATEYCDLEVYASGRKRLCLDGTIYDVTDDELAAFERLFPAD